MQQLALCSALNKFIYIKDGIKKVMGFTPPPPNQEGTIEFHNES